MKPREPGQFVPFEVEITDRVPGYPEQSRTRTTLARTEKEALRKARDHFSETPWRTYEARELPR
jgi:hypothetical protein